MKNTTKKSTIISRLAAVFLVATLATCSLVSNTYAKYVTSGEGTDTARVAKWGVEVGSSASAFSTTYIAADGLTNSVVSSTADKILAPGTSGEFDGFTFTGTPEVAINITETVEMTLTGWEIGTNEYYCPITINIGDTSIYGMDYDSAADFVTAVNEAAGSTQDFPAGTTLENQTVSSGVSWEWAFEGETNQTDANDTALGDLETAPTIVLAVTATVTQID